VVPGWLAWLVMLVGLLLIAFAKPLGRNAVKGRLWTPFMPPEVAILPERRRYEEDLHRWIFTGAGALFIIESLWMLGRAHLG
jgi:hypothetical protein